MGLQFFLLAALLLAASSSFPVVLLWVAGGTCRVSGCSAAFVG